MKPVGAGAAPPAAPNRPINRRAVGPRLRILLLIVFALVGLLGANSAYLGSITFLEWNTGRTYQNQFYIWMFALHLVLGLVLVAPFIAFSLPHILNTWNRKNRRALRIGWALFIASLALLISGVLLIRLDDLFSLRDSGTRSVVYWAHVLSPIVIVWLYWLHRLVGPKIRWKLGLAYAGAVAGLTIAMVTFHSHDPRAWNRRGSAEGDKYFEPSLARTIDGKFIDGHTMMMDDYCLKCHEDAYKGWFHSSHHFSSFNNPAYLASIRETREVMMARDGNTKGARWCAGCHDPVPFFSGAFDDPKYDDVKHPTAHAGITCTVCHAITHVNTPETGFASVGNADYTIEEPIHYPFARSDNGILQWINNQLVKAKPDFHKKMFLKPIHKSAEFCSTCHKVSLPYELNHYKEWLRGQNHYDSYHLSGASGHGARSFYYPAKAFENCASCHMPLQESNDFGARLFEGAKKPSIHDHRFTTANTGLAFLLGERLRLRTRSGTVFNPDDIPTADMTRVIEAHRKFLQQPFVRVDLFGVHRGHDPSGPVLGPLRPVVPELEPGGKYLIDAVIRTMKIGHHFSQGTVDSNEIWLEVTATSGGRVIGKNGGVDGTGTVDPWSHFINVYALDRHGKRIDRRNPQDIFVPLYDKQVPPGAANVARYALELPSKLEGPVTVEVKLQYRKFDRRYMEYVTEKARPGDPPIHGHTPGMPFDNPLPITTIATDRVTFPVKGSTGAVENGKPPVEQEWERWNDYGIGLLLEADPTGGLFGSQSSGTGGQGSLKAAEAAFRKVESLKRSDGPLNLARVQFIEGRLDDAVGSLKRAAEYTDPPAPAWVMEWLSGLVNRQQGRLDRAIENFRKVVENDLAGIVERKFDFSQDYILLNELGLALFDRAKRENDPARRPEREKYLRAAVDVFGRSLRHDSENMVAHYNLSLIHADLGDEAKSAEHARLHLKYKPDNNARDQAVAIARKDSPAADRAAERVVIYLMNRAGAPGLGAAVPAPPAAQTEPKKGSDGRVTRAEPVSDGPDFGTVSQGEGALGIAPALKTVRLEGLKPARLSGAKPEPTRFTFPTGERVLSAPAGCPASR
jgi:tetratricopeptide (TPR) repeat protein